MTFDSILLSRLQFAFTIGYHIIWPTYSIGVSGFVALLNVFWVLTGKTNYRDLARFWTHLFALGFVMGVVTGVVLSYQIGANWSTFSRITGNVLGPLFMYEALTAFFLEAGFIGILLFGETRVGRGLHLFASLMVFAGTIFSAFWVLVANSWMQTPAGAVLGSDGVFHVKSWTAVIFNASFPYRFGHMVCGSLVTGVFFIAGVSALHILRETKREAAESALSLTMWLALALVPLQLFLGDRHGLNTRQYQPMKLAAIEARWDTGRGVPLTLFAIPDQKSETNLWPVDIPHLGSVILTHSWNGKVLGLKEVPPEDRPYVPIVFFGFRAMVGIGMVLFLLSLLGAYQRWRGQLVKQRWFLVSLVVASPLGFVATIAGWIVTEAGRQPYAVYGILRTANAASQLPAVSVGLTFLIFIVAYLALLAGFLRFFTQAVIAGPKITEVLDPAAHAPLGRMRSTPALLKGAR
ncbi:MAG: cytochrome ubiquinol oxidase subunit I [Deltaproteobacteria bacterium]|nr:cytochrome ubiquinol oxidase subunit I [Deltaproteobacteria bacterium]